MKIDERWQALLILKEVIYAQQQLSQLFKSKSASPLTKAICFGVCRYYFRLEVILHFLVKKKPEDKETWLALLIGLFQLLYLDKPEYATVQETVALLDRCKKKWAKGLVNAVLRRFCREKEKIIAALAQDVNFHANHPAWLVELIKKERPHQWQTILAANDIHPPLALRINQQKTTREAYLKLLQQEGIAACPLAYCPHGVVIEEPLDITSLPGYAEGWFSVQDQSAQAVISFMDLQPKQRILDACAAPGGKTSYILESQSQLEACFALDIDALRMQRVEENLNRLQLNAQLLIGDAATPEQWWDGKLFDRILLDAPCSAIGVIRRHPDIKLLRSKEELSKVISTQKTLLNALWPLLKPGGLLIYATCSILLQENENQIKNFSAAHSDCKIVPIIPLWGSANNFGWQILPGQENGDGFFYSILRKE